MATAASYGVNIPVTVTGQTQAQQLLAGLSTRATQLSSQQVTLLVKTLGHTQAVQAINQLQTRLNGLQGAATTTSGALNNLGGALGKISPAANNTGSLFANLLKQSSSLGGALGALPGPLGQLGSSLGSIANTTGSVTGGLGLAAGAVVGLAAVAGTAAVALGNMALKQLALADDAITLAENLNVSLGVMNAMQVVAAENSGSLEGLTSAQNRYRKALTKGAEDNERVKDSLASLGLSFEQLANMSETAGMALIVQKARTLDTAEASDAATQLMTGGWRTQGAAIIGMADQMDSARERTAALTASQEALREKAAEAEIKMGDLGSAVETMKNVLAKQWANPAIGFIAGLTSAVNWMTQFMIEYNKLPPSLTGGGTAERGASAGWRAPPTASSILGRGLGSKVTPRAPIVPMTASDVSDEQARLLARRPMPITGPAKPSDQVMANAEKQLRLGEKLLKAENDRLNTSRDTTNVARVRRAIAEGEYKGVSEAAAAEALRVAKAQDAQKTSAKAAGGAASAAESAAKKAIRDAEQLKKQDDDLIISLERQKKVREGASQEQLAQFDIERGKLKERSALVQQKALEEAKAEDALKHQNTLLEQQNTIRDIALDRAGKLADAEKAIKDRIEDQIDARGRLNALALGRKTAGLGPKGAADVTELEGIKNTATGMRLDAQKELKAEADLGVLDPNAQRKYDVEMAAIDKFERDRTALAIAGTEQRLALEGDWKIGALGAMNEYIESAANVAEQSKNLFQNAFKGMEDALVNFAMTGKLNFKDLAKSIIADLIRIQARAALSGIMKMIMGGIGGGVQGIQGGSGTGGLSGGVPGLAKGGAFSQGVQVFAKGGMVQSPTFFGMGGQKTGLMGEQGIEAIMPLTRGRDGSLGVRSSGSAQGSVVNNYVTVNVESTGDANKDGDIISAKVISVFRGIADQQITKSRRVGGLANPI